MNRGQRIFDLTIAGFLSILLCPIACMICIVLWGVQGRPIFYISTRMRGLDDPFALIKFRTMAACGDNNGVTGGDKSHRITTIGTFLRKTRLDELPQLWNVLLGDMSLVGPRPPLPRYTEMYPKLYASVLKSRPGLTGLATLTFHKHENRMLANCQSAADTEFAYVRRCIPRKAKLDLIHQKNRTICYDFLLFFRTILKIL